MYVVLKISLPLFFSSLHFLIVAIFEPIYKEDIEQIEISKAFCFLRFLVCAKMTDSCFFSEGEPSNCRIFVLFFALLLYYILPRIRQKVCQNRLKKSFKPKYMVDKTVLAFLSLLFLVSQNQKVQNLYKGHKTPHCFIFKPKCDTYYW